MNIATKTCLSIGGIGTIAVGYFAGVKLRGSNEYAVLSSDDISPDALYISVSKSIDNPYLIEEPLVTSVRETKAPLEDLKLAAKVNLVDKSDDVTSFGSKPNNDEVQQSTSEKEELFIESKQVNNIVELTVKQGDTFISVAKASGVETRDLTSLLYGSGISQKQFTLKRGQHLKFIFEDDELDKVMFLSDSIDFTVLSKNSNGKFIKSIEKLPTSTSLVSKQIQIQTSLSVDGASANLSASDIAQVESALISKVDFSVLPAGSNIEMVLEQESGNGKLVSSTVKAIKVTTGDKTTFAYYYRGKDGAGFYDEDGVSLTPSFLRHPIKNPLITSRFNLNRKHPILKVTRPHWGTDYGHIGGTPIMSISDAEVKFAGDRGGFGKTVILKHPQGIETLSAHMSKFAKGIKVGDKVKKGQVVGYVGKTGLSTGYHLHFELKQNGKRIDSLKVDLPTVDKVDDLSRYKKEISTYSKFFS